MQVCCKVPGTDSHLEFPKTALDVALGHRKELAIFGDEETLIRYMVSLKLGLEHFRNRNRALPGKPVDKCRVKQGSRDGRCCGLKVKQAVVDCRRMRGPIEHICEANDGGEGVIVFYLAIEVEAGFAVLTENAFLQQLFEFLTRAAETFFLA